MNALTRDLFPYAVSRTLLEEITLVFSNKVYQYDGSFSRTEILELYKARVVDLQPTDIERLRDSGLNIQKGLSIALVVLLDTIPDYITRLEEKYRIVQYTIRHGVSTFIVDSLAGSN